MEVKGRKVTYFLISKVINYPRKLTFAAKIKNPVSEGAPKLVVYVSCAIIEKDGMILVAQRSALGSLPLKWEFPGGKVEQGETETQALIREIREELSVHIVIEQRLETTKRDDGWREIVLVPFICSLPEGQEIILTEHEQMRWLTHDQLYSVDWAEADLKVLHSYQDYSNRMTSNGANPKIGLFD